MHTRKAALVGCKNGPWISTGLMKNLKLQAKAQVDTIFRVDLRTGHTVEGLTAMGPGPHKLPDHDWARVSIIEGRPENTLCFFTAGD